jgi:ribosome modulation factor
MKIASKRMNKGDTELMAMKRAKRDKATRAYARGYLFGNKGRSRDLCPYTEGSAAYRAWMLGWRVGREDLWDGYLNNNNVACG